MSDIIGYENCKREGGKAERNVAFESNPSHWSLSGSDWLRSESSLPASPGHLTDKDLMKFLMRCKKSLRPNGVIIMKENMARKGSKLDPIDSSLTRHLDIMKNIIFKAGLEVLAVEKQDGFPDAIVPVWMVAMK